jgi:hypothetical protein
MSIIRRQRLPCDSRFLLLGAERWAGIFTGAVQLRLFGCDVIFHSSSAKFIPELRSSYLKQFG